MRPKLPNDFVQKKAAKLENITRSNAANSPLLRLPAELRNIIYDYAFTDGVIFILPKNFKFKGNPRARYSKNAFGLRFTCRQLRAETHDIFYRNYTFDMTGFVNGHNATRELMWKESSLIQTVRMKQAEVHWMMSSPKTAAREAKPWEFRYTVRCLRAVRKVEIIPTHTEFYTTKDMQQGLSIMFNKPNLEVSIYSKAY